MVSARRAKAVGGVPTNSDKQFAPALRANPRFIRYALAKFLQLTAQNSLIYGLFILIVSQQASSLATSAFVLTSILPSIVLSLPGGVLGDALPNKLTLVWTLLIRLGIAWTFFQHDLGLAIVLGLTTLNWAVYQFYTPGENAAVPALVQSGQLGAATALLQAVSLMAQLGGAGLLAPLSLKVLGDEGLFAIVCALLLAALILFISIPHMSLKTDAPRGRMGWLRALPVGIRTIRGSSDLLRATILRVVLDAGFVMLVVAAPLLVTEVLDAAPENAIYLVAPGALGIAAGLVIAPALARWTSQRVFIWTGYSLAMVTVLLLAWVPDVARLLDERTFLPLEQLQDTFGVGREIATTLLLLPIGGLGMSLVQVASRASVYEYAATSTIAQVFATQSAIGSVAALVPAILAGLFLDVMDVATVLAIIALFLLIAPIVTFARLPTDRRVAPSPDTGGGQPSSDNRT
jgi:hypothetical protein